MTRVVAAFDFDGTLTRRDTLAPFLVRSRGAATVGLATARHFPKLALAAAGRGSRDDAKADLLRQVYRDVDAEEMQALGSAYSTHVLARLMRNDTLTRLEWHRREGHELVLITASLSLYAEPIAERLGIPTVFATTLAVDGSRLTGELAGPNVRGAEKARLLRGHLGDADAHIWAYGDSAGDRELLAMADQPVLVKGVTVPAEPADRTPGRSR